MKLGLILGCLFGVLTLGVVTTDSSTVLAQEGIKAVCPSCKEKTRLRKGAVTPLEKIMVCPDCKGEGAAHVCDKCGAEVQVCPKCKKVLTAEKGAEVLKAVCPHCKVETTLKKGATVPLQKTMTCPNCEKPIEGFEVHKCEECGAHMAICPNCKKAL